MNQERLNQLVTQALERSVGHSTAPSISIESNTGAGRIEIPLVFAENFAELIFQDNNNGTT